MEKPRIKMRMIVGLIAVLLLLWSKSLSAAMKGADCLFGVEAAHILYCGQPILSLCTDGCHGVSERTVVTPSAAAIGIGLVASDQTVPHVSWMQTPYQVTYSSMEDAYRLVFIKVEIPLSSPFAFLRRYLWMDVKK